MFILNRKNLSYRNLANSITGFRLLLGLPITILLSNNNILFAWILIIIGGISDWLDGWLARRSQTSSKWGAQFDPLADKIMVLVPILWLLKSNLLPLWSIWILISRELIVTAWRRDERNGAPASYIGKIKTSFQFVSILILLSPISFIESNLGLMIRNTGFIFFYISLIMSFISAYNYLSNQLD